MLSTLLILLSVAEYFRKNHQHNYYSHRNSIAVALAVFSQAGSGGWQIYFAVLSKTSSTYTYASLAAAAVYILGSFFFFTRPWQFSLVPHMASSFLVLPFALYYNPRVCDTPVMTTEAGNYISHKVFIVLGTLFQFLAPTSSTALVGGTTGVGAKVLSPKEMCTVSSNTLMVAMGFLLLTLLLAVREAAEYNNFKMKHNGRGRPPTWWQVQCYQTLGSKDAIDKMRVFLIMILLVHITWTCHLRMVSP